MSQDKFILINKEKITKKIYLQDVVNIHSFQTKY